MKKLIPLLLICCFLFYQGQAQEWLTDFEIARQEANDKDQNILLVFSGSDWCAPCMKLEKEIWQSKEFKEFAKKHFTLVKADFPRKKKNQPLPEIQIKNGALAAKYNNEGFFPLVLVLNKRGKELGRTAYKGMTPSEYIELLKTLENS